MTHQWSKFQYAIANPQVRAEVGRAVRDGIPVEQPAAEFEISVSTAPERVERVRCGGAGGGGLAHQVLSSRVAPVRLIISNVPIELTPSAVHASGIITLLRRAGLESSWVTIVWPCAAANATSW